MIRRSLAFMLLLFVAAGPAAADTIDTPACKLALAATWDSMQQALARLRGVSRASQDDKCNAFRSHADVVTRAREVFERCKTGRDREGDLAQMDGALEDVKSVIERDCASR